MRRDFHVPELSVAGSCLSERVHLYGGSGCIGLPTEPSRILGPVKIRHAADLCLRLCLQLSDRALSSSMSISASRIPQPVRPGQRACLTQDALADLDTPRLPCASSFPQPPSSRSSVSLASTADEIQTPATSEMDVRSEPDADDDEGELVPFPTSARCTASKLPRRASRPVLNSPRLGGVTPRPSPLLPTGTWAVAECLDGSSLNLFIRNDPVRRPGRRD